MSLSRTFSTLGPLPPTTSNDLVFDRKKGITGITLVPENRLLSASFPTSSTLSQNTQGQRASVSHYFIRSAVSQGLTARVGGSKPLPQSPARVPVYSPVFRSSTRTLGKGNEKLNDSIAKNSTILSVMHRGQSSRSGKTWAASTSQRSLQPAKLNYPPSSVSARAPRRYTLAGALFRANICSPDEQAHRNRTDRNHEYSDEIGLAR